MPSLKQKIATNFVEQNWVLFPKSPPYKWDEEGAGRMTMAWIWTGNGSPVHFVRPGHGPGGIWWPPPRWRELRRRWSCAFPSRGMLCLWTGVMEIMRRSGLAEGAVPAAAAGAVRPVPPGVRGPGGVMDSISANVSANLLEAGQRGHPPGHRGGAADGAKEPRDGVGCHVHAGGMQHRLHPADPHHRGLGAGGGGEFGPL